MVEIERTFKFPALNIPVGNGQYIDTIRQMGSKSYVSINTSTKKSTIQFSDLKYYDENFHLIPDSLPFSLTNDVKLFVDETQEFTVKFHDSSIPLPPEIDEFGKLIHEYSPPYDSVKVIPAFIVNFSDSAQGIEHHDGKIIMIQEALNSNNEWMPIEYFSFSGCGNSYGNHLLDTNCYMMFGVNKYNGDFKTKLRIRLRTNGHTILSNEYSGYINQGQFMQDENEHMHHNYLK